MAVNESIYDQVANLQTEVAALTLVVNNLQSTVSTLSGSVSSLTSVVNSHTTSISNLQSAVNDTGWITLPLADGIEVYSTGVVPQYRKIGKVVAIRGAIKNVLASGTVATLPSGYRPSYSVPFVQNTSMRTGDFAMFSRMIVGSDGNIKVEAITDGAEYAANKWMPLHCVFMID